MNSELLISAAADLGMLPGHVAEIVRTAPLRYKVYEVEKRTGGKRTLAQPAKEVKALQYWLEERIKPELPVHEAARAYQPGSSIAKNAALHAENAYLLKMDFEDFFPSILSLDLRRHLERHSPDRFSGADLDAIERVLFWAPRRKPPLRLCIGAPTSPFVSNTLMFEFDEHVSSVCDLLGITYSRYADDLAFSCATPNVLSDVPAFIQKALDGIAYPRLRVNFKKTVHASKRTLRKITGIVVTPEGRLSVGRERKRKVRAMYFRGLRGELTAKQMEKLRGHVAFIESVEPGFEATLQRMQRKTGG